MSESDKKFYCEVCKKTFSNVSALNKHKKTDSHLLRVNQKEENEKVIKHTGKRVKLYSYYCPLCDYETERKTDMNTHIQSKGHLKKIEQLIKKKMEYTGMTKERINNYRDELEDIDFFEIGGVEQKTKDDLFEKIGLDNPLKTHTYKRKSEKIDELKTNISESKKRLKDLNKVLSDLLKEQKDYEAYLNKEIKTSKDKGVSLSKTLQENNKKINEIYKKNNTTKQEFDNMLAPILYKVDYNEKLTKKEEALYNIYEDIIEIESSTYKTNTKSEDIKTNVLDKIDNTKTEIGKLEDEIDKLEYKLEDLEGK